MWGVRRLEGHLPSVGRNLAKHGACGRLEGGGDAERACRTSREGGAGAPRKLHSGEGGDAQGWQFGESRPITPGGSPTVTCRRQHSATASMSALGFARFQRCRVPLPEMVSKCGIGNKRHPAPKKMATAPAPSAGAVFRHRLRCRCRTCGIGYVAIFRL